MKAYCHIYGQFDQTGSRLADEWRHLAGLGLSCDVTFGFAQAERSRDTLAAVRQGGGLVAPTVYPAALDPACRDPNWWKYPEEECVRLLALARGRFEALDLGPMVAVNTYTPGNGFIAACARLGIRYVLGFCAPIVIEDGGWNIAHYGSPLSPYFVAPDDFRKPTDPGPGTAGVLMLSMELRNPVVCARHWSEGPWCPLNAQAVDRWLEPSDRPLPFVQIAEDWLRQAEMTGVPKLFHINLQYFFAGRCYEHNRRALEWLAGQRDRGRLEVGSIRPWEAQMRSAGGLVRQTTYWRGEMMGFHVGHRPGSVADTIVDESLDRQAIWEWPSAVPWRLYDYSQPWHVPAFDPSGTVPGSADVGGITVQAAGSRITVRNAGQPRRVPLALWSVLEGRRGPFTVEAPAGVGVTVVPHPAGCGGAVLVEREWPAGETVMTLAVRAGGEEAVRHKRTWGHLVEAQTFVVDGRPLTYLAAQTPERFQLSVRSPVPGVQVESLCGLDHACRELPATGLPLGFDGTRLACWHRFAGIHADELQIEGVAEVEARLRQRTAAWVAGLAPEVRVPEPGYQCFGNIRDRSRWDRAVARAAGERERRAMTAWLGEQRPGAGEVLIEAHPGLQLPRGSITKVLGHEFDVVVCADGFEFRELCADYPQGWDWGVAAWVQWRHLKVQIAGLRGRRGRFAVHLHAFDPEGRGIVQRVHLFDAAPQAGGRPRPDLCVVPDWPLPQGVEGRWQPGALCSFEIPEECLSWSAVGIWVSPLEAMKLHDWIAERGAPGLMGHLWLTRTPGEA